MTKPRPIPNRVRWSLEDIYTELMAADRRMAVLIEDPIQTRTAIIGIAAMTQTHIRSARELITRIHPQAHDIVTTKRGGRGDDD